MDGFDMEEARSLLPHSQDKALLNLSIENTNIFSEELCLNIFN